MFAFIHQYKFLHFSILVLCDANTMDEGLVLCRLEQWHMTYLQILSRILVLTYVAYYWELAVTSLLVSYNSEDGQTHVTWPDFRSIEISGLLIPYLFLIWGGISDNSPGLFLAFCSEIIPCGSWRTMMTEYTLCSHYVCYLWLGVSFLGCPSYSLFHSPIIQFTIHFQEEKTEEQTD